MTVTIGNPITSADLLSLKEALGEQGLQDVVWAEGLGPPSNSFAFAQEIIFVICNSGMKNTVARGIYGRVIDALVAGASAQSGFKHNGKAAAIDKVWKERSTLFSEYRAAPDKLWYLGTLPWIGEITKYHLAKNFGLDVAKPDVHLQRLADREGCSPQQLCERLSKATGYRVATVDTILWRACANGVIDSRALSRGAIP